MISINKLELWEDANVRKNDAITYMIDLITSIKEHGIQVLLRVKSVNGVYKIFSEQRIFEAAKIMEDGIKKYNAGDRNN